MTFFSSNEALIRRFFAVDDGKKQHPEVTGALYQARLLPPYEPTSLIGDKELVALKVGAAACRIVELDVLYSLREGRSLVRLSRDSFNELQKLLSEAGWTGPALAFGEYALVRWANAAGRIFYRNKDWPQAESWMRTAADRPGVRDLSLFYDVLSDYARTVFERRRGSAQHEEGCRESVRIITEGLAHFATISNPTLAGLAVEIDRIVAGINLCADPERLKGVGSLLHNLHVIGGNWRPAMDGHADIAAVLPRVLDLAKVASARAGDEYRLEQIGHADARRTMVSDAGQIDAQKRLLEGMTRRNALVRRQQIALALADRARLQNDPVARAQAKRELYDILDYLREQRERLGPDYFDHDVHSYVLGHLTKPENKLMVIGESADYDGEEWDVLLREYRDLAESHRGLTSLARYKAELTAFVVDRMRETAGVHFRRVRWRGDAGAVVPREHVPEYEPIIDAVELASCRELLDVLAQLTVTRPAKPDRSPDAKRHDLILPDGVAGTPPPPGGSLPGKVMGGPSAPVTLGLRTLDGGLIDHELAYQKKRESFERFTAAWEVPAATHAPDILHRALGYTRLTRSVIIRYVEMDVPGEKGPAREVCVFLLADGRLSVHPCGSLKGMEPMLAHRWCHDEVFPNVEKARAVYSHLLAPIAGLDAIIKRSAATPTDGSDRGRLVIVPSPKLWGVPFHAALNHQDEPLLLRTPLVVTTSLSDFCAKNGGAGDTVTVDDGDDLVSLCSLARSEMSNCPDLTSWMNEASKNVQICIYGSGVRCLSGDRSILGREAISWEDLLGVLNARQPEFFVWITHGLEGEKTGALEFRPTPDAEREAVYPLDLIARQFLPRNKLTVLTACMGAQWEASGDEAEIAGFIRGFRGAGASAILAAQWKIGVTEAGRWLAGLAKLIKPGMTWRVSDVAHEVSRKVAASAAGGVSDRLAACVFCPFI